MKNPTLVVQRCLSVLRRSRYQSLSTRAFVDFPDDIRKAVASAAQMRVDELPIACCYFDNAHWVLVTTLRLISCSANPISLHWNEVTSADPDDDHILIAAPEKKLERNKLVVTASSGARLHVMVDPASFYPFWKVIGIMIATKD